MCACGWGQIYFKKYIRLASKTDPVGKNPDPGVRMGVSNGNQLKTPIFNPQYPNIWGGAVDRPSTFNIVITYNCYNIMLNLLILRYLHVQFLTHYQWRSRKGGEGAGAVPSNSFFFIYILGYEYKLNCMYIKVGGNLFTGNHLQYNGMTFNNYVQLGSMRNLRVCIMLVSLKITSESMLIVMNTR